jgi:hypothetical protein
MGIPASKIAPTQKEIIPIRINFPFNRILGSGAFIDSLANRMPLKRTERIEKARKIRANKL